MVSLSPLAGAERHFSGAELRRLAHRMSLPQLEDTVWPGSICFAHIIGPLARERVVAAIRKATQCDSFELLEYSLFPVPEGELIFKGTKLSPVRRDGSTVLTGSVVYGSRRQSPVWARVKSFTKIRGLVAAVDLLPGVPLTSAQIEIAELDRSSGVTIGSLDEIEGLAPRRRIAAGTPVTLAMLARGLDVRPGEPVKVRVHAGAANLSFASRAETGGRAGDTILLRNPDSGYRFRAKVEGRAQVSIDVPSKEN
jgi:flagella basal body P-ring formation protein FlgA